MLKTGKLSSLYDIDRSSLNYYVKIGLLQPKVLDNQYHLYKFEDIIALGQIRQYRGFNFDTEQIKSILYDKDIEEIIIEAHSKQNEIDEEINKLQLKKTFLHNLMESLQFINECRDKIIVQETLPYYFIPRENIESPMLKELYKLTPFSEFQVTIKDDSSFEIEALYDAQGLALKESWINEFNLIIPENSIYYPTQLKCITAFQYGNKIEDVKNKFKWIKKELKQMGYSMESQMTVYTYLTHYAHDNRRFDALCFIPVHQDV